MTFDPGTWWLVVGLLGLGGTALALSLIHIYALDQLARADTSQGLPGNGLLNGEGPMQ